MNLKFILNEKINMNNTALIIITPTLSTSF